jgi:UDP-N-acetyl-D-glucosamine dehydrogenase
MDDRTVAVVGLGYVGLPLALLAAERGWQVVGVDRDKKKVALIQSGTSPLDDPLLVEQVRRQPIKATTDPAVVAEAAVIVVAVPTPVNADNTPDLQPLISAVESIKPYLSAGQLLIIESTINPGVMDTVVLPLLNQKGDGPVFVVHCPERVNPGDQKWTVRTIPRVLGGYSDEGTKRAAAFYESILDAPVKIMASATEAEAVKILENTFRDINIAFINEMAQSFAKLGIDITHVIAGAATKPFAFMPHYPGNGVGGHCISVDPYYMIERARQAGFDHRFLKLAREINDYMPEYTVQLLAEGMTTAGLRAADTTVAFLGLAYKKNIDDIRESPALVIRELLEKEGYQLRVFDPHVQEQSTVKSLAEALRGAHAVMLATDHDEFVAALTPAALKQAGIKVVVDGKNALDADAIAAAGIAYFGIGRARQAQ